MLYFLISPVKCCFAAIKLWNSYRNADKLKEILALLHSEESEVQSFWLVADTLCQLCEMLVPSLQYRNYDIL